MKSGQKLVLIVEDEESIATGLRFNLQAEGYEALVALGHSPVDARKKIERATESKSKFKSVEDLINEVYRQEHAD